MNVDVKQSTVPQRLSTNGPTPEIRLKIRGALDEHFDDAQGMYLGGQSDQKLADVLNIPRIWIESIREAAYGPIRVTPELVELRADLVKAGVRVAAMAEEIKQMEDRLRTIEKGKS
jgi:hypothetical protein